MAWFGWIAAVGGILSIIGGIVPVLWLAWLGGIIALVFGIVASVVKKK